MKKQTVIILLFLCNTTATFAINNSDDSATTAFYAKLEGQLRQDYLECTGDSAKLTVKQLVNWKHMIDSLIDRPDYNTLAREYRAKTGKSPVADRPCAVVNWKYQQDSITAEKNRQAEARKKKLEAERAESLAVYLELSKLKRPPCLFASIPFGATRPALLWVLKHSAAGTPVDAGPYLRCDSLVIGGDVYVGAFFLDQNGKYCRYELEGAALPADSLNPVIRVRAQRLASIFEQKIRRTAARTNRIGRDEIAPGKLSILKAWSDSTWSVSVGLSVNQYRYYAKAVVSNAPLKRE